MWLPATPGWGPLVLEGDGPWPLLAEVRQFVSLGWPFPRHSWLRAPGAVPRHSWLGVRWCWWWPFPRGLAGGFPCCVCLWRGAGWCAHFVFVVVLWVWVCLPCVFVPVWRVAVGFPGWACCWCRCGCGCGWWVLWAVPPHSWRRFLCVFSRHSWLGFAAGGDGCCSPLLAEGPGCGPLPLLGGVRRRRWCVAACLSWVWSWLRFPATPGWGPPATAVAVSMGFGGGFLVVCVFVARCVRAWCLCWCVCFVFLVVAWVWVCLPCVLVCVCVCVRVWLGPAGACRCRGCGCGRCVSWLVPRHSWRRFLSVIPRHSWLGSAGGGGGCSSPLLAEGPGCGSPPLLAGVRWRRWCVVACHSWLRVPVAVPRHSWLGGPPVAVVAGPLPLLAEGLGGGSPPLLAGVRRPRRWVFPWVGVSRVVCACGAACGRGVCAGVCGVCSWCLCWW